MHVDVNMLQHDGHNSACLTTSLDDNHNQVEVGDIVTFKWRHY